MTAVPSYPSTVAFPISEAAAALESNLGLIHKAVGSVRMPEEFREDAFQEAAASFLKHYPSFDPARGRLSTFMWPHLRGAATHFLRSLARRPLCTEDTEVLDRRVDFAMPDFVDVDVTAFLASATDADRRLLYGMYWRDQALSEVARCMDVSRQSAHVRHKRLLAQARSHLSIQSVAA